MEEESVSPQVALVRELAEDSANRLIFEFMSQRKRHSDWTTGVMKKIAANCIDGKNDHNRLVTLQQFLGRLSRVSLGKIADDGTFQWAFTIMSIGSVALGNSDFFIEIDNRVQKKRDVHFKLDKEKLAIMASSQKFASKKTIKNFLGEIPDFDMEMLLSSGRFAIHQFPIRSDMKIPVIVPQNFSDNEKDRLVHFIKALPTDAE